MHCCPLYSIDVHDAKEKILYFMPFSFRPLHITHPFLKEFFKSWCMSNEKNCCEYASVAVSSYDTSS